VLRVASEYSLWPAQARVWREDGGISQLRGDATAQMKAGGKLMDRVDLGRRLVRHRVADMRTRRRSTRLQRLTTFRDLVVARLECLELATALNSYQEYGIYGWSEMTVA
jgi:hypothetical protein